jgi:hypothetical protein
MKRRSRRFVARFVIGVVSACLAFATAPAATVAQLTLAQPLTGEFLNALDGSINIGTVTVTVDCDAAGGPTFSYTATGPAVGPYPGTYTESGSGTLVAPTDPTLGFVPSGNVDSFEAEFTINSPVGVVTGTKEFSSTGPNGGICHTDTSRGFPVGAHSLQAQATYTAEITTATGTCTTTGTTQVNVAEAIAPDAPPESPVQSFDSFQERFLSGTACPDERTADEHLDDLITVLQAAPLGPGNSYLAKLQAIADSIGSGKSDAVCNKLNAFENEVEAQIGKTLTQTEADALLAEAAGIKAKAGCP